MNILHVLILRRWELRSLNPRRDEAYYNSREQIPGLSQDDNFPLAQRGKHVTNAAESPAQPRAINATRKSLSDTSRADDGTKWKELIYATAFLEITKSNSGHVLECCSHSSFVEQAHSSFSLTLTV